MTGTIPCPPPPAFADERRAIGPALERMTPSGAGESWKSGHQMVCSVAHGVKNTLGVVLMGTECLEKRAPKGDPVAARVAQDMRNAITRADAILRALLDLTATESLQRRSEDLPAVVEASLTDLKDELRAKGIVVARQFAPSLPPVSIDRNQWRRALTNLLANAITASPQHGTVTIQAYPAIDAAPGGPWIHLVIKDEGSGLPPPVLERLVEPCFTTNPEGTHAGLGLTVARRIVLAHGGSIALTNRNSGGTQVAVTLAPQCPDVEQSISLSEPAAATT